MPAKPSVIFIAPLPTDIPEFVAFEQKYECIFYRLTERDRFIKDVTTKEPMTRAIAVYAGFPGFAAIGGLYGDDLLDALPKGLKIIVGCAAGFNGYDLDGLRARSIDFCNSPNIGAPQVAETAVYHMITGFRKFHVFERALKAEDNTISARATLQELTDYNRDSGKFELTSNQDEIAASDPWFAFGERVARNHYIQSPEGKTVLVCGFGNIGRRIAKTLASLGMVVRYFSIHQASDEDQLGYKATYYKTLLEGATGADALALALPLTPSTTRIVNKQIFDVMNPGSVVVNVGRGPTIDNADLLEALKSGNVGHAGLDVFDGEPLVDPGLINRDDVVLTPHLGSCTEEVCEWTAKYCLKNIDTVYNGGKPESLRN